MNELVYMYISFGHNNSVSFITTKERAEKIANDIRKGKKTDEMLVLQGVDVVSIPQTTLLHINPEFIQYFIVTDNIPHNLLPLGLHPLGLHRALEENYLVCLHYGKKDESLSRE